MAIISGTGEAIYGLQVWQEHSHVPSEQKSIKGTGKLGTSNFVLTFIVSLGRNALLKISGKVAMGVLWDSIENFHGTHI